jgi:hypothetical protein
MAGIESLCLAPEVAAAWKKRVAVRVNSKGVEPVAPPAVDVRDHAYTPLPASDPVCCRRGARLALSVDLERQLDGMPSPGLCDEFGSRPALD